MASISRISINGMYRLAAGHAAACRRSWRVTGWTLIELVVILMIVGILAMAAMPRFWTQSTFDTRTTGDNIKAMMRYGQKLAISQNTNVYVLLNGSVSGSAITLNSIALCFTSNCSSTVLIPNGKGSGGTYCNSDTTWYCLAMPVSSSGLTFSISNNAYLSGTPTFYFNSSGTPYNTADSPPVSNFTSPLTLTVTSSGLVSKVTVESVTGYAH